MTPTTPTTDAARHDEAARVQADWRSAVERFEAAESELAGAVAEADQSAARRRDCLGAAVFDRDLFVKADADYKAKVAHVQMLEARRDVLRAQGEEAERRRDAVLEAVRRREIDQASREVAAAADAANAALVEGVKRLWREAPERVRQATGTSILTSGELWIRYFSEYFELRDRAAQLGTSIPEPYGTGLVGLLVRQGEIS